MIMRSGYISQLPLPLFFAILYLLFLLPLVEKSSTADGVIMCKENERQALLEFKQSLQAEGFRRTALFSSWDKKDCCAWAGVVCNDLTGYVEELNISNSLHVAGAFSPSLLKLLHLRSLDLSNNDFNGSLIPHFIGSFKNLTYLALSCANFRGPIPSQLGNLSMLETLYLDSGPLCLEDDRDFLIPRFTNTFSVANLEWLSHLSSLKYFHLSFTNLSTASDWSQVVNQLPFLRELVLRDCALPSVSSSVLSLVNTSTYLSLLDLSGNDLTSSAVYPWLFNVSNSLVVLDLSRNQLTGPVRESFGNMIALEQLYLGHNQLEGGIYRSFWNMCRLSHLNMEFNRLSAFGFVQNTFLCRGYSLWKLRLAENQLKGSSVLNEIAKVSSLGILDLRYNLLNGTISESIGQLSNLRDLRLAGNSFDNVVISEAHFSNLTMLRVLDLSRTSLTLAFKSGWIPPFQLKTIELCSCKLGQRFPEWLRTQTMANFSVDISDAEISGSLPIWFRGKLDRVRNLNLSFNQINGTWPNISHTMISLDVSANNLSGPLPQLPQDLSFLEFINLSKNKFSGLILSICNVRGKNDLQFLDLSRNLLSGEIPDCFAQFRNLRALNLADNKLSGLIPSFLGSLTSLEMLSLRGNRFCGRLPSSLQNCEQLKFLDLSENKLVGKIPLWIGPNLSSLVFLSLQANQFNGELPHQLCELKYLRILDLSVNKISDIIPLCLSNLTSMAQKVSSNQTTEHLLQVRFKFKHTIHLRFNYIAEALLTWKGHKQKYEKILGLLVAINLSCNKLIGEIPEELTSLQELIVLNLSRNLLTGQIPQKIGHLRQLQVLDLSRNELSGSIPPSLSEITFLCTLDLSYNYLSGQIPAGTQLQSFDPSVFSHNQGLCGPPVSPNCSEVEPRGKADCDGFEKWFYFGMGLGFIVGFWGFCVAVLLKRSWRHSYFILLDDIKDWLYVSFVVLKARLRRRIET